MPYSMNNKPELIKNLPANAQKIWIATFNNEYSKSKNEESSIKIAWSAVKKAGYSQNKDGTWKRWE